MVRPLIPLHLRAASQAATVERRVKTLENRVAPGAQTGVIPSGYTSGNPTVTVGSDTSATGPYQYLSGYTPAAGDTVALVWLAGTWLVIGKLA